MSRPTALNLDGGSTTRRGQFSPKAPLPLAATGSPRARSLEPELFHTGFVGNSPKNKRRSEAARMERFAHEPEFKQQVESMTNLRSPMVSTRTREILQKTKAPKQGPTMTSYSGPRPLVSPKARSAGRPITPPPQGIKPVPKEDAATLEGAPVYPKALTSIDYGWGQGSSHKNGAITKPPLKEPRSPDVNAFLYLNRG